MTYYLFDYNLQEQNTKNLVSPQFLSTPLPLPRSWDIQYPNTHIIFLNIIFLRCRNSRNLPVIRLYIQFTLNGVCGNKTVFLWNKNTDDNSKWQVQFPNSSGVNTSKWYSRVIHPEAGEEEEREKRKQGIKSGLFSPDWAWGAVLGAERLTLNL